MPVEPRLCSLDISQSVQSLSCVQLFVTPWTAAHQASLSITNSQSPPKPMSIKLVMPFNHLILCHPLLLLPSIFPSIRVFSNESVLCKKVAQVQETMNATKSKEYSWLKTLNLYYFKTLNLYFFFLKISFLNTRSLKWYSQPFISPKKIYSVFFILCIIQDNQKHPKFWGCFSLYTNPS